MGHSMEGRINSLINGDGQITQVNFPIKMSFSFGRVRTGVNVRLR